MSEIINCECGTTLKSNNHARHLNSKTHLIHEYTKQINKLDEIIDYHEIRASCWWLFPETEEGTKAHKKCCKFVQKMCIARYELKQMRKALKR